MTIETIENYRLTGEGANGGLESDKGIMGVDNGKTEDGNGGVEADSVLKSEQSGKEGSKNDKSKRNRPKRSRLRRYSPHVLVTLLTFGTLRAVLNSVDGWPTPLQWHVILAVLGYQVLQGHGTLIIHTMIHHDSPYFKDFNKKRIHYVIAGAGAILSALATYIIYSDKEAAGKVHWASTHAQLGLAALVLTAVSLVNGTVFYWWQELGISKGNIKFLHTLTGLLAYSAATAALGFGYDKKSFHRWSSTPMAYFLMALSMITVSLFSLSPGRIILNKLTNREHVLPDKGREKKHESGEAKKKE